MKPVQTGMTAHDSYNLAYIVSDQSFFEICFITRFGKIWSCFFIYKSRFSLIFQNKTSSSLSF